MKQRKQRKQRKTVIPRSSATRDLHFAFFRFLCILCLPHAGHPERDIGVPKRRRAFWGDSKGPAFVFRPETLVFVANSRHDKVLRKKHIAARAKANI